jgi:hypothetical protein
VGFGALILWIKLEDRGKATLRLIFEMSVGKIVRTLSCVDGGAEDIVGINPGLHQSVLDEPRKVDKVILVFLYNEWLPFRQI